MSDLSLGWAETTLGQVGDYLNGRGFKKSEWRDTGRPIIRIQNLTGTGDDFNHFGGEPEERHTARSGDLLVSWAATLGVFVWTGPEAVVNQHIFKVRSHIDRGFHRYLLLSVLETLRQQAHGSGMVHITKGRFEQTPIEIPPLAEQRRIVAAIEEQFSLLDAAEASLRRAQRNCAQLRRASLAGAFDGGWPSATIGDVGEVFVGATPSRARSAYWGGEIPWVSSGEVAFGRIGGTRESVTHEALGGSSRRVHPPGTVLLAMIGEGKTRGQSAILDTAAAHNQNSAAIRLDTERVRPEFLFYWLMRRYEATRRLGSGNNQPALNKARVQAIPLPVPPLEDQSRVVQEVERQLSLVEALDRQIEVALLRTSALRRAILSQAFTGNLVPQDPSDEPASVLLGRIAAERAARPSPPRREARA